MSTALLDRETTTYVCVMCHGYDEGCTPNICHGFDTD